MEKNTAGRTCHSRSAWPYVLLLDWRTARSREYKSDWRTSRYCSFRQQLKHFYFVNIDTSPSTTLAH